MTGLTGVVSAAGYHLSRAGPANRGMVPIKQLGDLGERLAFPMRLSQPGCSRQLVSNERQQACQRRRERLMSPDLQKQLFERYQANFFYTRTLRETETAVC